MESGSRWASRNLSRLEKLAVLILLLVVLSVYLDRGLRVFADAEKASVLAATLNLNSALRVLLYERAMSGRGEELAAWQGGNPIAILGSTALEAGTAATFPELARFDAVTAGFVGRYVGEADSDPPPGAGEGDWYFLRGAGLLVYLVRNGEYFHSDLPGPPRLRFRLDLSFDDLDGDGKYNPALDRPRDVVLRQVDPYRWNEEIVSQ